MHEVRAYCGIASVGPYLYAIGGYNGISWLKSMERYDPLTNQVHLAQALLCFSS
jgi:Kelch motif